MAKYIARIVFLVFILLLKITIILVIFNLPKFVPSQIEYESVRKRLERISRSEQQQSKKTPKYLKIEDGAEHLMWFIQISDIHITIMKEREKRNSDLREFAIKTLDVIKPTVVLASGDLTHATTSIFQSRQYELEWKMYQSILNEANVQNKTIWLDLPGNHDLFNVPSLDSKNYFFRKYSIQGYHEKRSYSVEISSGQDKYSFIGVDTNQIPGTKRAFNFYGILNATEAHRLIDLAESSRKSGVDYIVWFGHYPSSAILSVGKNNVHIGEIFGRFPEGYIYLSGHFHTLGGMVEKMYAFQEKGFFDLELGDWKSNRMFRVAAFDHGIFSFVDVKHNEWPIILVTNPKDSRLNTERENPGSSKNSTHIRILIFDPIEIIQCGVRINVEDLQSCSRVADHLFVRKWDPHNYRKGPSQIEVHVKTQDGREKTISQTFSLDGSKGKFPAMGKIILKHQHVMVLKALISSVIGVLIISLTITRIWHELAYAKKLSKPDLNSSYMRRFIRKLWIFSAVDRLFFPNLLIIFYILVGPWAICYAIDKHNAVVFLWGIFVKEHFLPGNISYLSGYFQLIYCNMPLIYIYASLAADRYQKLLENVENQTLCAAQFRATLPFLLIMTIEVILGVCFTVANGLNSLFFGPLRTWLLPIYFLLYYFAQTLPRHALKSVTFVLE